MLSNVCSFAFKLKHETHCDFRNCTGPRPNPRDPRPTSTGPPSHQGTCSATPRWTSLRWVWYYTACNACPAQRLRRNSNYGPSAEPAHWVRPARGRGPRGHLQVGLGHHPLHPGGRCADGAGDGGPGQGEGEAGGGGGQERHQATQGPPGHGGGGGLLQAGPRYTTTTPQAEEHETKVIPGFILHFSTCQLSEAQKLAKIKT